MEFTAGDIVAWKISPENTLEVVEQISETELKVKRIGDDSGFTMIFHPDSFQLVETETVTDTE